MKSTFPTMEGKFHAIMGSLISRRYTAKPDLLLGAAPSGNKGPWRAVPHILRTASLVLFLLSIILLTGVSSFATGEDQSEDPATPHKQLFTENERAWLLAHPTISIGIMDAWPPMNYVDNYGVPRGIGVDYLKALNKRLNGVLQIVPRPFKESLELVKDKKLDGLMDVTPKAEREEFLNFTSPYLTIPHAIIAREDGPFFQSEKDLNGHILALEEGFFNVGYFQNNYPQVKIRQYASTSEALEAVIRGEADAYAGNRAVAMFLIEQELMSTLQVQGRLTKEPVVLTIGVRKDWPELVTLLEHAFADIQIEEDRRIKQRWLGDKGAIDSRIWKMFTPVEQEWLKNHPTIWVGNNRNFEPFDFSVGNRPFGYGVDFLNLLAAKIGLHVDFINGYDRDELEKMCRDQLIDLLHSIPRTPALELDGIFSDPFKTLQFKILSSAITPFHGDLDDLRGQKVGVMKNGPAKQYLSYNQPDIQLVITENLSELLKQIEEGDVIASITDDFTVQYLRAKDSLQDIAVSEPLRELRTFEGRTLRFLASNENPELISILNKTMLTVAPKELQQLEQKWIGIHAAEENLKTELPQEFNQGYYVLKIASLVFFILVAVGLVTWLARGRPKDFSIRQILFGVLFIFAGLIILIGTFTSLLLDLERELLEVDENRFLSIHLAYELKQSSDDLTRLARTYAITGDPKYARFFQDIVDIRDGLLPHPSQNSPSYWDLVTGGTLQPDNSGETYSIQQKMVEMGLSEEELAKLTLAKNESDELLNLEAIAMNAARGIFRDVDGNFTIKGEPDLKLATQILHGPAYHGAKAKIMKPIDEFFSLLETRTSNRIQQIHQKTYAIILAITLLTFLAVLFAVFSFFLLKKKIIKPIERLKSGALKLKSGNYSHHISIDSNDEIGDLAHTFNSMSESVKERTTKLKSIFDTALDAIIVISGKKTIVEFSPAAEQMFGYTRPDIMEHEITMILPELFRNEGNLHTALETQTNDQHLSRRLESFGQRKNSSTFPCSISMSEALIDEEQFFIIILRDISLRKEAEQELKKLSSAVEQSPVSVMITDKDGNIEYINSTFTMISGYTFNEVQGKNLLFNIMENEDNITHKELWHMVRSNENWSGDLQGRTKSGQKIWESTAIAPLFDDRGNIAHFVAIKEDITERRKLEKEIEESENLHRLLAECSADMIIQYGTDGNVAYVSPACQELTGFTPDEIIGRHMTELFHPQEKSQVEQILNHLQEKLSKVSLRARMLQADNSYRWIDTVSQSILDHESEKVTGILSVSRDITEQKMLEDARQLSLKLNQMIDSASIEEILEQGLEECVKLTESHVGYFLVLTPDRKNVDLQIWSQNAKKMCNIKQKITHTSLERAGIWADCIRKKSAVIHNDYLTLPCKTNQPQGHIEIKRHVAVPVIENTETIAVLGIGNKLREYTPFDIDIMQLLAENMWGVIRRKRSAEIIQENERRLELILRSASLGYWDLNIKTREAVINERWAEMLGLEPEKLTSPYETWKERIHPDDKERIEKIEFDCREGITNEYHIDYRLLFNNGETRWFISKGAIVSWDSQGKALRLVGVHMDITNQKNTEQELRQNMEDLQRFSRIAITREEKMIDLKEEVNTLLKAHGELEKYKIVQ